MIIKNIKIFTPDKSFRPGEIIIRNDIIENVVLQSDAGAAGDGIVPVNEAGKDGDEEVIDGDGCYCIPGMIDLHFHGCMGCDFSDGSKEALQKIADYEASVGVTAIVPASMTLPVEELQNVLKTAKEFRQEQLAGKRGGADLLGVNMEGPFISKVKKGAQNERYIIPADIETFRELCKAGEGMIKFIGLATEEVSREQAETFIQAVKADVTVALAHTNADYDRAKSAFEAGASHLIHLYNAMPPFHHREPGVIGAAAESRTVTAEIICDGVHVHPSAVRAAFSLFGEERLIFISDSMRATGMPDGKYLLGGQEVEVNGSQALLAGDGALAGSVTNLPDCVRNAVKNMGIPLETAIACVTMNPAKVLKEEKRYGSIEPGKQADLVLWDENLELKRVIIKGKIQICHANA